MEPFLDHMRVACEIAEAGFYYESGGCWGMALALSEELKKKHESTKFFITNGFVHAYVKVGNDYFDYTGSCNVKEKGIVFSREEEFIEYVLENYGFSIEEIESDKAAAREIIEAAKEMSVEKVFSV